MPVSHTTILRNLKECVRGQTNRAMTARQIVNVDVLKAALPEFTMMRHLAMRFQGLLRGGTVEGLDIWLTDARTSEGIVSEPCSWPMRCGARP